MIIIKTLAAVGTKPICLHIKTHDKIVVNGIDHVALNMFTKFINVCVLTLIILTISPTVDSLRALFDNDKL